MPVNKRVALMSPGSKKII